VASGLTQGHDQDQQLVRVLPFSDEAGAEGHQSVKRAVVAAGAPLRAPGGSGLARCRFEPVVVVSR
jgi:hypothetical protein